MPILDFAEVVQHWINQFESLVDLLSDLGSRQDDFAADKDQQHDLWLHHAVDEAGEQLRLVGREVVMATRETFKTDGELDVTRAHDVLYLEIYVLLSVRPENVNHPCSPVNFALNPSFWIIRAYLRPGQQSINCIVTKTSVQHTCKFRVVFRLGASYNHLARSEDERRRLRFADTHDDGGETLRVVLGVASMQRNRLEVQATIEIDGGHDVSLKRHTIKPQLQIEATAR